MHYKEIYAQLNEPQLAHLYEPEPGLFIAETPMIISRALAAGYIPTSLLAEENSACEACSMLEKAGFTACVFDTADFAEDKLPENGVAVIKAPEEDLTHITGFKLTRGMMCAMLRKELPSVEEVCCGATRIAVLEDVMNPTNVGAIFRSAAALNIDAVLLTPGCSDPLYRRAARVAMGTCFAIPWTYLPDCDDTSEYVRGLKQMGFTTVAMALRDDSYAVNAPELKEKAKLAIILGTESEGLKEETIATCDYTVKIPMSHGVDSLNVAAAGALAFWELGKNKA